MLQAAEEAGRRAFVQLLLHMAAEKIHDQRRHQRAADEVAGEHGEDHRLGQRQEEITRHAGQKKHRHEDDADAQRGDESRHRNLLRAVENRRPQFLPEREIAMDVFDLDRGVIHEDADRQREPAEGHDIDRLAEHAQRGDRAQHRERDGHRDDDRAPPAPEEKQDHQRRQRRGDDALFHHAADRRAHEDRLIRRGPDVQLRRHRSGDGGQQRLHAIHHVKRGRRAVFENREQRAAHAVEPHDVLLRLVAVARVRHVAQIDRCTFHLLDWQVVQLRDLLRAGVEFHVVFGRADLRRARRQDEVLRIDRGDDIGRREPFRLERAEIEIDRDLPRLAAKRKRQLRPAHG